MSVTRERKKKRVPEPFIEGLKSLSEYGKEVGGGIKMDKDRKRIQSISFFPSDRLNKIEFDKVYDIEFHTHPVHSGNKVDIVMSRIPSAPDVASTFSTGKEEIIFTKGYTFKISIYNRKLFERAKRNIRNYYKEKGKTFGSMFARYKHYFSNIFRDIDKESKKGRSALKSAIYLRDKWKRTLLKYGIKIERIQVDDAIFNLY